MQTGKKYLLLQNIVIAPSSYSFKNLKFQKLKAEGFNKILV